MPRLLQRHAHITMRMQEGAYAWHGARAQHVDENGHVANVRLYRPHLELEGNVLGLPVSGGPKGKGGHHYRQYHRQAF